MGKMWTDNDWKNRIKRLITKIGASPVLPILAWTKTVESIVAGGPLVAWVGVGVIASAWFVIAEDFAEFVSSEFDGFEYCFNR